MNKYVKMVLLLVILYPIKLLYKRSSLNIDNDKNINEDILKNYLVNDANVNDITKGIKPKLWIHVPYDKNSRFWDSFYSRNTNNLNQPYIYLTLRTIIDKCSDSFNISLIDDSSFEYLLPDIAVNLNTKTDPIKSNLRKVYMLELLKKHGGFVIPPSLLCLTNLIDLYNEGIRNTGCFIIENASTNLMSKSFVPDSDFIGSTKENEIIIKLLDQIYSKNMINYLNNSEFNNNINSICDNFVKNNRMSLFDATTIGAKKMNGAPTQLEDILGTTLPNFSCEMLALYVPSKQLLKRTKYSWFSVLSIHEILASDIVFNKLLINSY